MAVKVGHRLERPTAVLSAMVGRPRRPSFRDMETVSMDSGWGRLSPQSERALLRAAASGDPAARERLIGAFAPMIARMASAHARTHVVDQEELVGEGVAGLLAAMRRYDAAVGEPFRAYAAWWIRQAMGLLMSVASAAHTPD
jgi:DNA-directed RNA polymerase sigma subunit (sigma70/sigma32)